MLRKKKKSVCPPGWPANWLGEWNQCCELDVLFSSAEQHTGSVRVQHATVWSGDLCGADGTQNHQRHHKSTRAVYLLTCVTKRCIIKLWSLAGLKIFFYVLISKEMLKKNASKIKRTSRLMWFKHRTWHSAFSLHACQTHFCQMCYYFNQCSFSSFRTKHHMTLARLRSLKQEPVAICLNFFLTKVFFSYSSLVLNVS